ncbi:MAG: hypothetical protein BGP12_00955 [Rhodospirillales bacterium 70-18]|nr:MAG: hypothetical protein BGP12_00955 [Rhodospirillales bacterium 70-18]
MSNGSLAVLAGNFTQMNSYYYGFDQLQIAILPDSTPTALNPSTGLTFPAGESPNNGFQSPTVGGGTLAALPSGGMAVLTWGDTNLHYDLQILDNAGAVTTAPVVVANQYTTTGNNTFYAANAVGAVAGWSGGLVVAWSTDDVQRTFYQRYTLAGVAVGGVVSVAAVGSGSTNWYGSMAVDSQGDVIFGFSSTDIYHPGTYKMFNSSDTLIASGTVENQEVAPRFAPVAGGGFITAGYQPVGSYNSSAGTYPGFTLQVQQISTGGAISTVDTVTGIAGGVQTRSVNWIDTVGDGTVHFLESGSTTTADIYNVTTGVLTRNGETLPALAFAISPTSGTETNVVGVAVNGSNQLVAEGLSAACYAAGTRIRTTRGEVPIEQLSPGDQLISVLGGTVPVIWIGHRRVDCRRHRKPQDVWPVRVAAGAFGEGVPARDVLLSPDHSVYVATGPGPGVLIPVRHLINGTTIAQHQVEAITYFHVEAPTHDVILAEGMPAETYLDTGNRGAFANGGGVAQLDVDFARRVWDAEACATLVTSGRHLAAAKALLLARAQRLGHRSTADQDPHLLVDGTPVAPTCDADGRYRFAVPSAARSIRLCSRSAIPAEMQADSEDHRRLGLAITALWLDGVAVALDDPRLASGWWLAEDGLRWTDGDAALPLAYEVVFTLAPLLTYPVANAA